MTDELNRCLDDLEARIDPEVEDALLAEWADFVEGRFRGGIFSPQRRTASAPGVPWPAVRVNATLDDFDAMALQQYGGCSGQLAAGGGLLMAVRSNFGTSIIPLLFGVELFVMADELDTLPTSKPLHDISAIKRIVDAGVPDLTRGFGARVLEMGERFVQIGHEYPRIGQYVHIYHPDLQGPMDICEVVWGSSIFYALYDQPELVKALLDVVTDTYLAFMREWTKVVSFRPNGNCHWGFFHKGNIALRDDSAMNLSPAQVDEFVRPCDQRLLDELGGGIVHFCGRGDHFIPSISKMRGLTAINLSQPEYNDMEIIFTNTIYRDLKILGLNRAAAEEALARGRDLHGSVHCM